MWTTGAETLVIFRKKTRPRDDVQTLTTDDTRLVSQSESNLQDSRTVS